MGDRISFIIQPQMAVQFSLSDFGTALPSVPVGLSAAHPGLGKLIFSVLFPVGLMITVLHGVELFTGNTMKVAMALYEGKINFRHLLRNWTVSYIGNFVGSLMIVGVVMQTGLFPAGAAAPVKVAVAKCSVTFTEVRMACCVPDQVAFSALGSIANDRIGILCCFCAGKVVIYFD